MGHLSGLCHLRLCRIRGYVVQDYVAFGVMLLGIMSHRGLCCILGDLLFLIMSFWLMLFGILLVYPESAKFVLIGT